MARGYSATLDVKCWKEHTCCYCGAAYRYLARCKKTGHGSSQEAAVASANSAALRTVRNQLELRPCPGCGHHQPEMIGARRLLRHGLIVLVVGSALLTLFLLGASELVPTSVALWPFSLLSGASLIAMTWVGAHNPNGNLRTNKARAARLIEQGQMQLAPAEPDRDDRPRPVIVETGIGFWLAFLLLGATLVLMPGSEFVRFAGRWPTNHHTHPPIIGTGDTFWTWIELDEIKSLRGYGTATGTGKILGDKNLKPPEDDTPVSLSFNDVHWPDLSARASEEPVPVRLWVQLTIPQKAPGLARRVVPIELNLKVKYPEAENGTVVEREKTEVKPRVEVHLATHRAGFLYRFFWYVAVLGGGTMFVLAAGYHLMRDLALRKCGLPTRVIPIAEQDVQPPPPQKTEAPAKTEETEAPQTG
jgi:hypothetical protein